MGYATTISGGPAAAPQAAARPGPRAGGKPGGPRRRGRAAAAKAAFVPGPSAVPMRIPLSRPHLAGTEDACVAEALASGHVGQAGPQLDAFEAAVAARLGAGVHCIALASITAARHLALRLAGVGAGDEVWLAAASDVACARAVLDRGARLRLFDGAPAGWTIDPALVAAELDAAARAGRLPRAILPADLCGQSVDLAPLEAAAAFHGVALVVDAAGSLGATAGDGRCAGSGGDASLIAFGGDNVVTTSGGAVLATRSAELAQRAQALCPPGTAGDERLSNVSAAIGLAQMAVLDLRVAQRRAVFDRYRAALSRPGVGFMPEPAGFRSTRWLTAMTLDPSVLGVGPEDLRRMLHDHGIEARRLRRPLHLQPAFEGVAHVGRGFDAWLCAHGLCLPSGSDLTPSEQGEVIDRIACFLDAPRRWSAAAG